MTSLPFSLDMLKVYKAKTLMSINVVLASGKNKFLMFDQMSDGTGLLRVKDPVVQEAVERDAEFGKNFYLYKTVGTDGEVKPAGDASGTVAGADGKSAGDAAGTVAEADGKPAGDAAGTVAGATEMEVKTFSCFDDAREWANTELGIQKSKIRTMSQLATEAANRGYTINYED